MKKLLLVTTALFYLLLTGCQIHQNPLEAETREKDEFLIKNGSFEITSNGTLPLYWQQSSSTRPDFHYFKASEEDFVDGKRALKITYIDSLANKRFDGSWGGLTYRINTEGWNRDKTYRIKFWYKALKGNFHIRVIKNGDTNTHFAMFTAMDQPEWREKILPFNIDKETEFIEVLISTKTAQATDGIVDGWMDDVRLTR
jgi:hypothetical protein